ncbi:MAG: RNase adapter RapZ [Rhodospirillales bacterium]|nr:RNase adapter RapZ [Rhodospirillales bacterium]
MTDKPPFENSASTPDGSADRGTDPGRVVIVTGLSGAGRTTALKAFEDLGYEAVDNLPLSLLGSLVNPRGPLPPALAIGIDIRTRDFGTGPLLEAVDRLLAETGLSVKVLFIDCEDDVLCRRYTETRHRHPLAVDRPLIDGILHERRLMAPLRERADFIIDTSNLSPSDFKRWLEGHFALGRVPGLVVFVTSFAYRGGLPREADLVFDVRFLDNPHYRAHLRPLTGRDGAVADFVRQDVGYQRFLDGLTSLLRPLLPRYAAEGKSYLTIGIGCTGGRHRSVVVAEELSAWLRQEGLRVELRHRELEAG